VPATVHHLQLNVRDASVSLPFYRALLGYLGYAPSYEARHVLAMTNGTTDFWFFEAAGKRRHHAPHRKDPGLNHVAFRVSSREEVDRFQGEFLAARRIAPLYGGPREYPEYRPGYYAVFFEDPDRLKLEVVHVP
jgi:glyoxylase I family protein